MDWRLRRNTSQKVLSWVENDLSDLCFRITSLKFLNNLASVSTVKFNDVASSWCRGYQSTFRVNSHSTDFSIMGRYHKINRFINHYFKEKTLRFASIKNLITYHSLEPLKSLSLAQGGRWFWTQASRRTISRKALGGLGTCPLVQWAWALQSWIWMFSRWAQQSSCLSWVWYSWSTSWRWTWSQSCSFFRDHPK